MKDAQKTEGVTGIHSLREVDISRLFSESGMRKKVNMMYNDNTYEVRADDVQNSWIYLALAGFQAAREEKPRVGTFVSVGTGPGTDGIGANEILKPKKIILTDIHKNVLPLAEMNFLNNLGSVKPGEFKVLYGSLCEPLEKHGIKADVLYANLPNVPFHGRDIFDGINTASYFSGRLGKVPKEFRERLLSHQYAFLCGAKNCLYDDGLLLVNIGGRMPFTEIENLFKSTGFSIARTVTLLKRQSEADVILKGYSDAEKKYGREFDFYAYDEAARSVPKLASDAHSQRSALGHCRMSASQAYAAWKEGARIAHLAHFVIAKKAAAQSSRPFSGAVQ